LFLHFLGCSEDNLDVDLGTLDAPQNISALTTVTQDNTERLLLPRGEGVTQYEILLRRNFCSLCKSGGIVEHTYKEGIYDAKIIGTTLNGKKTEVTQKSGRFIQSARKSRSYN
jgi:hypothetical protein